MTLQNVLAFKDVWSDFPLDERTLLPTWTMTLLNGEALVIGRQNENL